jgi:hypothetical protein
MTTTIALVPDSVASFARGAVSSIVTDDARTRGLSGHALVVWVRTR